MGNGAKKLGWMPADDENEVKAEAGEPYQGQDGNWYQHPNIAEASRKNPPAPAPEPPETESADASKEASPHPTPPAVSESKPSAEDLDAVAAEEAAKHATAAPPSIPPAKPPAPVAGGPTNPSYDADKFDSTGKNKKDGVQVGPRGADKPGDVMTEEERNKVAKDKEARLAKGMTPTHSIDSVGKPKGQFAVTPQGNDKNGARLPDKVDYAKPVAPLNPVHGPRGVGAPKDTFHRS